MTRAYVFIFILLGGLVTDFKEMFQTRFQSLKIKLKMSYESSTHRASEKSQTRCL